jgi:hypothetical protein
MTNLGAWKIITLAGGIPELHLDGWQVVALTRYPLHMSLHDSVPLSDAPVVVCPRCAALVFRSDSTQRRTGYSIDMRLHEAWHAETDHPIPLEVRAEWVRLHKALPAPVPTPTLAVEEQ